MNATYEMCKEICNQQAINQWSNASLGIAEILFTSFNILMSYIVYKKIDRNKDMFHRESLFRSNNNDKI